MNPQSKTRRVARVQVEGADTIGERERGGKDKQLSRQRLLWLWRISKQIESCRTGFWNFWRVLYLELQSSSLRGGINWCTVVQHVCCIISFILRDFVHEGCLSMPLNWQDLNIK